MSAQTFRILILTSVVLGCSSNPEPLSERKAEVIAAVVREHDLSHLQVTLVISKGELVSVADASEADVDALRNLVSSMAVVATPDSIPSCVVESMRPLEGCAAVSLKSFEDRGETVVVRAVWWGVAPGGGPDPWFDSYQATFYVTVVDGEVRVASIDDIDRGVASIEEHWR